MVGVCLCRFRRGLGNSRWGDFFFFSSGSRGIRGLVATIVGRHHGLSSRREGGGEKTTGGVVNKYTSVNWNHYECIRKPANSGAHHALFNEASLRFASPRLAMPSDDYPRKRYVHWVCKPASLSDWLSARPSVRPSIVRSFGLGARSRARSPYRWSVCLLRMSTSRFSGHISDDNQGRKKGWVSKISLACHQSRGGVKKVLAGHPSLLYRRSSLSLCLSLSFSLSLSLVLSVSLFRSGVKLSGTNLQFEPCCRLESSSGRDP